MPAVPPPTMRSSWCWVRVMYLSSWAGSGGGEGLGFALQGAAECARDAQQEAESALSVGIGEGAHRAEQPDPRRLALVRLDERLGDAAERVERAGIEHPGVEQCPELGGGRHPEQ